MKPKQFRAIREELGLTQQDLAQILGLSNYLTISHYETGFRRPSELVRRLMHLFVEWPDKKSLELRSELQRLGEAAKLAAKKKS